MSSLEKCLWCNQSPAASLEHIIPEALGCPEWFVLKAGVCGDCNNKNGRLDRALLLPFEPITVIRGIPRKRGKPPTIDGFSTVASLHKPQGPHIFVNRDQNFVQMPNGKRLGPKSAKDPFEEFVVEKLPNGQSKIQIKQRLQFNRNAVRALFKISLEALAFNRGLDFGLSGQFDNIRQFVRYDVGEYSAILTSGEPYDIYTSIAQKSEDCPIVATICILQLGFICDFDPNFSNGIELLAAAEKLGEGAIRLPN